MTAYEVVDAETGEGLLPVSVETDGHPLGTRIRVNGVDVYGVTKLDFSIGVDRVAELTITTSGQQFELEGSARVRLVVVEPPEG